MVQLESGMIHRKHVDHFREWVQIPTADTDMADSESSVIDAYPAPTPLEDASAIAPFMGTSEERPLVDAQDESQVPHTGSTDNTNSTANPSGVTPQRYPRLQRYPMDRFCFSYQS